MSAAQWDGLVRLGVAALVWTAILGVAWLVRGKRTDADEEQESTGGFWQR